MKKEMKRITALLLAIVMVMGVVVNSDILRSRAAGEASTTVDVDLDYVTSASGGSQSGIYVITTPGDNFEGGKGDWGEKFRPKAVTGGVYVDGELMANCPIIKWIDGVRYYIELNGSTISVQEGTKVTLDGIYGRNELDTQDGYTVKFNKTTFLYTNNAWKKIVEEETDPSVTADITLDVTLEAGDKNMLWVKGDKDDQMTDPGSGWNTSAERVTGGIYVDGTLDTSRYLMKLGGQYAIGLNGTNAVNVVPGTTIVLDGIYKDYATDYKVQFNKATFEYTQDGWRQVEEAERVPDDNVTPYLAVGDANMITLWTDKVDNLPSEGGWCLQNRVNGGIYVNGVLIRHCPFVKQNETTYLIPLADAGVANDITEGSTVVLDGIYGPEEYQVKFNKAVFQYIEGKFQQIFTADAIVDPAGSNPTDGIYFYTNVPDGLAIGEGDGIWAIHHNRYSGGIYVDGELSETSTFLVKIDSQMNYASYYIDLMGYEVKDGTRVVIDGVFGETQQLKVNKATFVYDASAGKWKQPANGDSGATDILGDADANNDFNVIDFVHMLRYVAADTEEINLTDADMNKDQVIDDLDLQMTREILAGKTVTNGNYGLVGKPTYNGTKRLSIGAYCGPRRGTKEQPTDWRTDAEFKRYADAGFNTLIAEYDVAYGKNYAADGTESAVKNFVGSDLDNYMGLANKYGLDVIVESPILNQVLKGNAALENAGAEITEMLSALKGMKNFKGILMSDEPSSDQISHYREVSSFLTTKDVMQGKSMFVSLLPYNVQDRSVFEDGYGAGDDAKYESYLREFGSSVGGVNPDIYPFEKDGLMEDYYKNLEMAATAAKGKTDSGVTIQSFAARDNDGIEWIRSLNQKEYYTYQLYSAMAYGMKNISYYTYWQHFGAKQENIEQFNTVINADGTVNADVYNSVKAANEEISKFDQVYMDFNWQGTMKSASSNGLLAAMSDYKSARVNQFAASADTIMGCLKDSKGYDGFMLVNATDPKDNTSSNVTVQFKNAQKAIVYRKGIESVVELSSDGTYTTTLPSGEGEFIIPYQESGAETSVAVEANVDVNFIEGDKTGINFWTDSNVDSLDVSSADWSVRPVRVQGGIYLNGVLKDIALVKLDNVLYRIVLDDGTITITEGTTIVLDGVYSNADGTHPTRFNKVAFEFVNGAFRQIESNIVPTVKVDSSLNDGNVDGIFVGTTPGDDWVGDDTWAVRPERVTGGIYVNGELKANSPIIKLTGQYYLAVSDSGVKASEGMVVVFNGIYGDSGYAVQFNRAVFVYRGGNWVQCSN